MSVSLIDGHDDTPMKKYIIGWETDFCDDGIRERSGYFVIEAYSVEEAIKTAELPYHAVIIDIKEVE